MRRRRILIGAGALLLAVALGLYFTQMPAKVANDYEERAEPQTERIQRAVQPTIDRFGFETFAVVDVKLKQSARGYLSDLRRATTRDLRQLESARRAVKRAKRSLARIDEEAMTDVPSWPLLGGMGELESASDTAGEAGDYLRKARAYVRDFGELVEYSIDYMRFGYKLAGAGARAEVDTPKAPTSVEQITRPLEREHRVVVTELLRFRRHRPPKAVFGEHHATIAETERLIRNERALIRAVRVEDYDRADRITARINRDFDRNDRRSRKWLRKLMDSSRYTRQIDDLVRREERVREAFEEL